MKSKIYSVYDIKAKIYDRPFFLQNSGVAMRAFGDAVKDSSSAISKHPEDYRLFELGEYNDLTAKFEIHSQPIHVADAIDFQTVPVGSDIIADIQPV